LKSKQEKYIMKNISKIIAALFAVLVGTVAMAQTINLRNNASGYAWKNAARTFVVSQDIDLSQYSSTSNPMFELIQVTGPSLVEAVRWEVTSRANAGVTFTIGDGNSNSYYVSSTSATNLANGLSTAANRYYTANDSIDVVFGATVPTTGVLNVRAVIIDLSE